MRTVEAKDNPSQFHGTSAQHGGMKVPQDKKFNQLVSEHSVPLPKEACEIMNTLYSQEKN